MVWLCEFLHSSLEARMTCGQRYADFLRRFRIFEVQPGPDARSDLREIEPDGLAAFAAEVRRRRKRWTDLLLVPESIH